MIRTPFASSINALSLHVSVCRTPIGRRGTEIYAREVLRVDRILTFSTISCRSFPMLKQRGNVRFSSACHAPTVHPSERRPSKGTCPQRPLGGVQISATCSQASGPGAPTKHPLHQKSKHTEAHYLNSILEIKQCSRPAVRDFTRNAFRNATYRL